MTSETNAVVTACLAAIDFAITLGRDAAAFLRLWNKGCWPEISRDFPDFDLATAAACGYIAHCGA